MRMVYHQSDLRAWEPTSGHTYLVLPLAFYEGWQGRRVLAWVLGRIQAWSTEDDLVAPGVQSLRAGSRPGFGDLLRHLSDSELTGEDVLRLTGERDLEEWEKAQKVQKAQEGEGG